MTRHPLGVFMAEMVLPEKSVFNGRVYEISNRIDAISKGNKMAQLLFNNFKNWLSSSALSPIKLTEDLDKDNNGMISGDEFASLLGSMTGERPPEWVVELVFSFVDAEPDKGIPLDDWMAFLSASGLEIPEHLYTVPVVITGSLSISPQEILAGQSVSISASFNQPVVAYEVKAVNTTTGEEQQFITPSAEMDTPTFDEFVLDGDAEGEYVVSLIYSWKTPLMRTDLGSFQHRSKRLKQHWKQKKQISNLWSRHTNHPFPCLVSPKWSKNARGLQVAKRCTSCDCSGSFVLRQGTVMAISRTLLGTDVYRNGMTARCQDSPTVLVYRVMMKETEVITSIDSMLVADIAPVDWDIARREVVCQEIESLQRPSDDDSLHFLRSFVNLCDFRIPEETLEREFFGVAVTAEDLDGSFRDPHRRIASEQFGHADFFEWRGPSAW